MKYLSFDVGIKNLAFCSLNDNKQILDWGIINLDKNPKCQCGLQKECQKSATFIVTCDNGDTKYSCTTHNKKYKKKKKINADRDIFNLSKILIEELNLKTDFLNHGVICIENQPALKNPVMKTVQMILYSYFMIEGATKDKLVEQVHMINARNKLKVYKGPPVECKYKEKYKRNKYLSVEYTKLMILQEEKKFIDLFNESKKKDDLADAYLQGIYFIDK
jgi:hypothetical protein